jgi:hypothetical protein
MRRVYPSLENLLMTASAALPVYRHSFLKALLRLRVFHHCFFTLLLTNLHDCLSQQLLSCLPML